MLNTSNSSVSASKAASGTEKPGTAANVNDTPVNTSKRATRNFELDKTISHTKAAPGKMRRLSVAVIVDNKQVVNEDGEVERKPLSPDEITMLTGLVKEAIGFSADRGDTVQVINKPFTTPPALEPLPEPPLLEKPWLWDVGKMIAGGVVVLLMIFFVLRPMLRALASQPVPATSANATSGYAGALPALPSAGATSYEASLNAAKSIAAQDPKRVAQVVKNWVGNDA